ncbi:hypothetical protein [Endozoicomonas sp. SCSIO W0465]|uniref:hypothetical protein n=1 Tax=Endozoicomonas sp. SCSIO W0465 TaxID=2918516 RepID=UPI00207667A0|nr:hypothetical protein [Endozoicomonas sp. SCSIO W0465]USE38310.1 hypothetical protein MJO57_09170 [Endozoicomonas sp. SCSIO W0465]
MSNPVLAGGANASQLPPHSAGACPPPPAYSVVDTNNPDGLKAVESAKKMIQHCSDPQGRLNSGQLSRLLDMTIKYIEQQTGVLPSVVAGAAANNPVSNNPTNPDLKDWGAWEKAFFRYIIKSLPEGSNKYGTADLNCQKRQAICKTLGANIGLDQGKILSILRHPLFLESLQEARIPADTVRPLDVKVLMQKARDGVQAFDQLFLAYETRGYLKPTGMIKAAIELGYLPLEDIETLYSTGSL